MAEIEAVTDGEKMVKLDGKIDLLNNNMENVFVQLDRVLSALEKLETTKVMDHETRLTKMERWQSEWQGGSKLIMYGSAALAIFSVLYTFAKK